MLHHLIDHIKTGIDTLSWVDRSAGLTRTVVRKIKNRNGQIEDQSFPVSTNINETDCVDDSLYKWLAPDDKKMSVLFWSETSAPVVTNNPLIARRMGMTYVQTATLFVWVNLKRLQVQRTPDVTFALMQELISHIHQKKIKIDTPVKIKGMTNVVGVRQHERAIFTQWSFGNREDIFIGDFDFFAIDVEFIWQGFLNCYPTFAPEQYRENCRGDVVLFTASSTGTGTASAITIE